MNLKLINLNLCQNDVVHKKYHVSNKTNKEKNEKPKKNPIFTNKFLDK